MCVKLAGRISWLLEFENAVMRAKTVKMTWQVADSEFFAVPVYILFLREQTLTD